MVGNFGSKVIRLDSIATCWFSLLILITAPASIQTRRSPILTSSFSAQDSSLIQGEKLSLDAVTLNRDITGASDRPRRFALVATGSQIKLYPFADDKSLDIATNYYIVVPDYDRHLDLTKLNKISSFTKWLKERELHHNAVQNSILPKSSHEQVDEPLKAGNSGWKSPLITEVDFLFDWTFCDKVKPARGNDDCLVVVWLDKANKLARYGSIDLRKQPIEFNPPTNFTRQVKTLFLKEFPPIDPSNVIEFFAQTDFDVYSMRVDRRSGALAIAYGAGSGRPSRLIFGYLDSSSESHSDRLALRDAQIFSINGAISESEENSLNEIGCNLKFANEISPAIPYQLKMEFKPYTSAIYILTQRFKCDSEAATGLLSLPLHRSDSEETTLHPAKLFPMSRNNIRDLQMEAISVDEQTGDAIFLHSANNITRCSFTNETFSCSNEGRVARARSSTRQIYTMQFHAGSLFISDPSKKTLSVISVTNKTKLHQVLLVESPAIFGFRLGSFIGNERHLQSVISFQFEIEAHDTKFLGDVLSAEINEFNSFLSIVWIFFVIVPVVIILMVAQRRFKRLEDEQLSKDFP